MSKLLCYVFILLIHWNVLHSEIQKPDYSSLKNFAGFYIPLLQGIAAGYSIAIAGTVVHELGHALVGKMFMGAPIDVNLGASSPRSALINLWGIKVFNYNILNYDNNTVIPLAKKKAYPLRSVCMSASGPLAGLLFLGVLLKTVRFNPVTLPFIYWNLKNQIQSLLPYKYYNESWSDAYQILHRLNYTPRWINICSRSHGWPSYIRNALAISLASFMMHQLYMKRTFNNTDALLCSSLLAGVHTMYQLGKNLDII